MSNVYRLSNADVNHGKLIQLKPIEKSHQKDSAAELSSEEKIEQLEKQSTNLLKRAEDEIKHAKERAQKLIEDAENRAKQMKQELESEAKEMFERAKNEGFEEGFLAGKKEAEIQFENDLYEAQIIVKQAHEDYKRKIIDAEEDVLMISLQTAEKIINQQLKEEPSMFVDIIKEVIEEWTEQPEISIYVHPSTYNTVLNARKELEKLLSNKTNLSIFPNKHLSENGCKVESPLGVIDTSIDTKLELLKKELLNFAKGEAINEPSKSFATN